MEYEKERRRGRTVERTQEGSKRRDGKRRGETKYVRSEEERGKRLE